MASGVVYTPTSSSDKAVTLSVYLSLLLQKENTKTQLGFEMRQQPRDHVLSLTLSFVISIEKAPQGWVGIHPQMFICHLVPSLWPS